MGQVQVNTAQLGADALVQEASVSATVIRCGCATDEARMAHALAQQVCPTPAKSDKLGVVAFSSRNSFRQWIMDKRIAWKEGRRSGR